MICNNCNCQCNDEKYYQEWVPATQYSVGDFFRINKEVFKAVDGSPGCGRCEFYSSDNKFLCENSGCDNVFFILYDTIDENEYES